MKFAEKEFSYYWKIIRIPLAILVAWSLIGLIIAIVNYTLYTQIFSNISGWIITIAVFGFIGYTTTKDHKGEKKHSFWAGGIAGAISGFITAIISIIRLYLVPEVSVEAIAIGTSRGIDAATMETSLVISTYAGLILIPLVSGLIGAIISWIGGLIGKKA